MPVAGGPLGDALPVTGLPPVERPYGAPPVLIPAEARVAAIGLERVEGWLNVTRPFTSDEIAGRVLLLDFWTLGCVNCIIAAPTIDAVAHARERDPVLVIGVHSQKFTAEAGVDTLRKAVITLGTSHPVAVDPDHGAWQDFNVNAWPTLFVIDARGRIAKRIVGEPSRWELDASIEAALAEADSERILTSAPLGFLGREVDKSQPLAHPESVELDAEDVIIADTGHHRVVVADRGGTPRFVAGDGAPGHVDGPLQSARFFAPRGTAVLGTTIYVADTGNHRLRAIERDSGEVVTVGGTGARGGRLTGSVEAATTALASPWGLLAHAGRVYVALAGTHQIARYDPSTGRIEPVAGTGAEGLSDGPGNLALLAQPSGLATDGQSLFFADAESSSIRKLAFATLEVETIVGSGLFEWGDVDGPAAMARLQHAQGVAWGADALWVADTYNSKLKAIELATGEVRTVAGNGTHDVLFGPADVAYDASGLFVADSSHDRIVVVDPATGAVTPWEVTGLQPP
jgi:thiol-disulfide isomerase/thioredoxin